jgi:prohibitin 2
VIQNIGLTRELQQAIESKMVQEQEAQRSKFVQQRAQIEADTAVIKAKGEAESIKLRGEALKENPAFVDLQIVDKWDGFTPLVIGGPGGSGVLMTMQELEQRRRQNETSPPPGQPGVQRRSATGR